MVNANNTYNSKELNWKPTLNADGTERIAQDGTKEVQTEPTVLVPQVFGKYGGWSFEGVDGFWSWKGAANLIEKGVPVEVVLKLGKQKATGSRYQDILHVNPVPTDSPQVQNALQSDSPSVNKAVELGATVHNPNNPTPKTQMFGEIDTNTSIREQAFFNNLTVEMLQQMELPERAAAMSGYIDTMFLMMRPAVRERALRVKREMEQIEAQEAAEAAEAAKEEQPTENVAEAPKNGTEEQKTEEITEINW